ncbi:MAG: hypothetical protein FWD71_11475 [Oscillospiraceae bacterium]|nr:hypothetical protein [Oscillospiraceae bacterium]
MNKKSFTESISDEVMAKIIDDTLNFKKTAKNRNIKTNLLKIIPAVAAIVLVIGGLNLLPAFLKNTGGPADNGTGNDANFVAVNATSDTSDTTNNLNISNTINILTGGNDAVIARINGLFGNGRDLGLVNRTGYTYDELIKEIYDTPVLVEKSFTDISAVVLNLQFDNVVVSRGGSEVKIRYYEWTQDEYTLSDDSSENLVLTYVAADKKYQKDSPKFNVISGDWVNTVVQESKRNVNPDDPAATKRTIELTLPENVTLEGLGICTVMGDINVNGCDIQAALIDDSGGTVTVNDSGINQLIVNGRDRGNIQNGKFTLPETEDLQNRLNNMNGPDISDFTLPAIPDENSPDFWDTQPWKKSSYNYNNSIMELITLKNGTEITTGSLFDYYNQQSTGGSFRMATTSTLKLPNGITINAPKETIIQVTIVKGGDHKLQITIGDGDATIIQSDGTSSTVPSGTVLDSEGNVVSNDTSENRSDNTVTNNGCSYWGSGGTGHDFSLKADDIITFDIVTISGGISLNITDNKSGKSIYSGENLKTGTFDVTVNEDGEYLISFTFDKHSGNFKFKISGGDWILPSTWVPEPPDTPDPLPVPTIDPLVVPSVPPVPDIAEFSLDNIENSIDWDTNAWKIYNDVKTDDSFSNYVIILKNGTEIRTRANFNGLDPHSGEMTPMETSTIKLPNGIIITAPGNTAFKVTIVKGGDHKLQITIGDGDATIIQSDGTTSAVPSGTILDGEGNVVK